MPTENLFHFRALDETGVTIRQSTTAFPTAEAAQAAAARADRIHGDDHVVCISLEPKDPRNNTKEPLKAGFKVYDPATDGDTIEAQAEKAKESATVTTKAKTKRKSK